MKDVEEEFLAVTGVSCSQGCQVLESLSGIFSELCDGWLLAVEDEMAECDALRTVHRWPSPEAIITATERTHSESTEER